MGVKRKATDEGKFSYDALFKKIAQDLGTSVVQPSYTGSSIPKIMIVSDEPEQGKPLGRKHYTFLTKINAGRMSQIYLTTYRKNRIATDNTLTAILFEEIEEVQPLIVITFGPNAANALRKKKDLDTVKIIMSGIGVVIAVQCLA